MQQVIFSPDFFLKSNSRLKSKEIRTEFEGSGSKMVRENNCHLKRNF